MNFEPNTSLNLNLSPRKKHQIEIDLELDPSSLNPSPESPPFSPIVQRVFSCNYCRRKFYSSQALGGHQNAHKLERTLAKKSRELSSVVRPHSGLNERAGSSFGNMHGLDHHHQGHVGRFGRSEVSNYRQNWSNFEYNRAESVNDQEDLGELDLSLRL